MFLVTGATGNIGGELVEVLLAEEQPVRALTRQGASGGLPSGVEVVTGDLNRPESMDGALSGVTGVFLLPGYADMSGLLDTIRKAEVQRVVLLSGQSAANPSLDDVITRYLVRSENAVLESGVAGTILRPSAFMSNTLDWAPQLRQGDVVRAPFADVPVAVVDPLDIAEVASAALRQPGHAGETYPISGPSALRPADRVRILGEVLDRRLSFEAQPDDEARQEMLASMPAEYVDAFLGFYAEGKLDESQVYDTVSRVTGRPARSFRDWADRHASAFAQLS